MGSEEDGDSAPAGLATVTANFADNFAAAPDFGSDGPGSATYSLVLTGSNVASGLFALGVGGAAGASIVLNQAAPGADIIGTVGGTEYFRISIDPATGVVTFSQSLNVWHANTASDDDTSTLTLANAADLQVVQTVTDADGDRTRLRSTWARACSRSRTTARTRLCDQCAARHAGSGRDAAGGQRGGRRQCSGRPCDGDGELCRQLCGGAGFWQRRLLAARPIRWF